MGMKAIVFDEEKGVFQVGIDEIAKRLPADRFYWLDLDGASTEEIQTVAKALRIPEPTSSWLPRFGQRPRFEVDETRLRISTFAVGASGLPTEGHLLYSPSWILTVHAGAGASTDRARVICETLNESIASYHATVALIILTEFMAGFNPLLDRIDEQLGELEDQILREPKAVHLQQLSGIRKQTWSVHRLWEPQYESIREFVIAIEGLPSMREKAQHFADYAERIADLMDKINDLRQRANEAMESYGTSVSNRQSQVMNRLTIISAIFLPLTFLTGYFGMNFQWMNNRLDTLEAFLLFGIGMFLGLLTATLLLFKGRRWLGEGRTLPEVSGGHSDNKK